MRVRWWLALALAVVLVGAAMPSFTQPDPARAVAKLAADVERLDATVRRGKAAPNMRDLADGNLFDAEDGQVPVYNAATGTWRPGVSGAQVLTVFWDNLEVAAPTSSSPFQFERGAHSGAANLSWSEAQRDRIHVTADGTVLAFATVRHNNAPLSTQVDLIQENNTTSVGTGFIFGFVPFHSTAGSGSGVAVVEPSTYSPAVRTIQLWRYTNELPTRAQLTVVFFPGVSFFEF